VSYGGSFGTFYPCFNSFLTTHTPVLAAFLVHILAVQWRCILAVQWRSNTKIVLFHRFFYWGKMGGKLGKKVYLCTVKQATLKQRKTSNLAAF